MLGMGSPTLPQNWRCSSTNAQNCTDMIVSTRFLLKSAASNDSMVQAGPGMFLDTRYVEVWLWATALSNGRRQHAQEEHYGTVHCEARRGARVFAR